MPLDIQDLAAIRAVVRAELSSPVVTDRILTTAEAFAYTKHESQSAFYRWCTRWRVTSSAPGRYARSQLDNCLEREAAKKRMPRAAPLRVRPE